MWHRTVFIAFTFTNGASVMGNSICFPLRSRAYAHFSTGESPCGLPGLQKAALQMP